VTPVHSPPSSVERKNRITVWSSANSVLLQPVRGGRKLPSSLACPLRDRQ
jgi:hypothetical protein